MAAFVLASCGNTKFLSEGESLVIKHEVEFTKPDTIKDSRSIGSGLLRTAAQKPNEKIFFARARLWLHNRTRQGDRDTLKGLRRSIHDNGGEPPVIFDSLLAEQSVQAMRDYMFDKGYFNATVNYKVKTDSTRKGKSKRKTKLTYVVTRGPLSIISDVIYAIDNPGIDSIRKFGIDKSELKANKPYDVNDLRRERSRIASIAQNVGYRDFSNANIFFEADTLGGQNNVAIYVQLAPPVDDSIHRQFIIKKISVHIEDDRSDALDSLTMGDVTIYFRGPLKYSPRALINPIQFRTGNLYARDKHVLTSRKYSELGVFQFVSIRYENDRDTGRYSWTDMRIELKPAKRKSITAEAAANSASDQFKGIGSEVKLTFSNKNTFRYTDLLTFNASTGIETNFNEGRFSVNTLDFNADARVAFPKFVLPWKHTPRSRRFNPTTSFASRYTYLRRLGLYDFQNISLSYGIDHQETDVNRWIGSLSVLFSGLLDSTQEFKAILAERPTLRRSFEDVTIFGPALTFIYSNQARPNKKTSDLVYLRLSTDLGIPMRLFGKQFSSFGKLDGEVKDLKPLGNHASIVGRFTAGIGVPFGTDAVMPYIKQFVAGGPNSVRAWRVRSLGPGAYDTTGLMLATFFEDQTGDIKLEANLEFRFDIYGGLKGAIFLDAGNVWLIKPNTELPNGEFNFSTFAQQIAVGSGGGLRFDFDFFILRVDIGAKLRIPHEGWLPDGVQPLKSEWRREHVNVNLGIGYPF